VILQGPPLEDLPPEIKVAYGRNDLLPLHLTKRHLRKHISVHLDGGVILQLRSVLVGVEDRIAFDLTIPGGLFADGRAPTLGPSGLRYIYLSVLDIFVRCLLDIFVRPTGQFCPVWTILSGHFRPVPPDIFVRLRFLRNQVATLPPRFLAEIPSLLELSSPPANRARGGAQPPGKRGVLGEAPILHHVQIHDFREEASRAI
jgi:hypothetical protein